MSSCLETTKLGQVVTDCPCFRCYMAHGMSCKLGLFKNFKDSGNLLKRLQRIVETAEGLQNV